MTILRILAASAFGLTLAAVPTFASADGQIASWSADITRTFTGDGTFGGPVGTTTTDTEHYQYNLSVSGGVLTIHWRRSSDATGVTATIPVSQIKTVYENGSTSDGNSFLDLNVMGKDDSDFSVDTDGDTSGNQTTDLAEDLYFSVGDTDTYNQVKQQINALIQ